MPMPCSAPLFIASDVHWRADATASLGAFGRFLTDVADNAGPDGVDLYVLGDLFDFWYERGERVFDCYRPHLQALARATAAGVRIHVLFGNRDFTYREALPRYCGAHIAGDQVTLRIGERRVSMQHGDLLCSADWRYQLYRRLVRGAVVRSFVRLLPWSAILGLIAWLRRQSRAEVARKAPGIMQVVDVAVSRELDRGFDLVVCGHVHRAERRSIPGTGGELLTLGPWTEDSGSYAAQVGDDLILHSFP